MELIFTPATVSSLKPNEVFVFGSNIHGHHSGGAALFAKKHFGAIEGQGEGLQGQSYAIPTVGQDLKGIKKSVEAFILFTRQHPELHYYVTAIGCKNAGYSPEVIAPFFERVFGYSYVSLPKEFAEVITEKMNKNYSMRIGDFEYIITDIKNHKAEIVYGPQYGCARKSIEFAGEKYEVVGVTEALYYRNPFLFVTDKVNYLDKMAFFHMYSDDIFNIPKSLEFYGAIPFPHCEIHSHSDRFEVVNGLVIDHKFNRVVQCIDHLATHVDVPEGIKEIHDGAFYKCQLKSIKLPSTLKTIAIDAFWDCRNLQSITIPESVEYVGDYCFSSCFSLKDVRLEGWKVASGKYPFHRTGQVQLYVPKGHGNAIKKILKSTYTDSLIEY